MLAGEPPVLLSDPRILAIPVREIGEPLVTLRPGRRLSVAAAPPTLPFPIAAPPNARFHRVRRDVARRLLAAAAWLPPGVRLHVVEGYRPMSLQRVLFDAYAELLGRDAPRLSAHERRELASRFVAPPGVAAHPSGAAVDVTLADQRGQLLDMGTRVDATPEESEGACYFAAEGIGPVARANRNLLACVLTRAGFVNYPTEWWHWSFGDRYWAFVTGQPVALFGAGLTARERHRPIRG